MPFLKLNHLTFYLCWICFSDFVSQCWYSLARHKSNGLFVSLSHRWWLCCIFQNKLARAHCWTGQGCLWRVSHSSAWRCLNVRLTGPWKGGLYLCTLYLVSLYLVPLLYLGRVPALYLHQICLQCRVQWCSLDGSFRPKCVSWQWVVSEGLQPVRFQDIWHHQPPAAQKYCTAQMAYFHYFHFHWSPPIWQHFQCFTFSS